MRVHRSAARLRALLKAEGDFATILRGAGLVVVIRILASALGFASALLLARWMGPSEYGLYSFAIAWMTVLAYFATLGLPGTAVRFVAQYAAVNDWPHVAGFLKVSSWLTFGCGMLVAMLAIAVVLVFRTCLDQAFVTPTIIALAGTPIVAIALVRSEAIRGLGWLALAWGPLQLGQPLLLLLATATILLVALRLTASMAVGASIFAYLVNLIAQLGVLHVRLGAKSIIEPKIQLGRWLRVSMSFVWIFLASVIFLQAGVIVVGIFLRPEDVAVYSAAAATSGLAALPLYAAVALGAPKFAMLNAQQRRPELQALFTNIVRSTFWPSLVVTVVFAAFGSLVLRLFGPGFQQGYWALLILTLGQLASAFVGPVVSLLTMTGHQAAAARALTVSAILAVMLGLAFTWIWGTLGTAIAFSGAMVLWNAWLAIFAVRKLEILPSFLRR